MDANGNNSMRKARWPIQILGSPLPWTNKNTQSQTRAERAQSAFQAYRGGLRPHFVPLARGTIGGRYGTTKTPCRKRRGVPLEKRDKCRPFPLW